MSNIYLYNEDCQKTIDKMAEKNYKVDLIVTSPPYNTSQSAGQIDHHQRYDVYFDMKSDQEYCDWMVDIFNGFDKVLEKDGCILWNINYGSSFPDAMWLLIGDIIRKTPFMVADNIAWKKKSSLPNSSRNKLSRIIEFVIVFCRKSEYKTFKTNKEFIKHSDKVNQDFYKSVQNFIEAKNNDGSNPLNKATFSSELILKLLDLYCNKDFKVIYDPFMGTGTTALAVEIFDKENKLTCIGSEISENQVEFSKQRIDEYRNPDKYKNKIVNE